jgi:hypothetical protein
MSSNVHLAILGKGISALEQQRVEKLRVAAEKMLG